MSIESESSGEVYANLWSIFIVTKERFKHLRVSVSYSIP